MADLHEGRTVYGILEWDEQGYSGRAHPQQVRHTRSDPTILEAGGIGRG